MKYQSIKSCSMLLVLATALALPVAHIQRAEAASPEGNVQPPKPESAEELAEVVVTGTNIRSAPDQIVVPVITLDSQSLEKNGVGTSVLEGLRKAIPAFEGRSNVGASNTNNSSQFTGGGSQVQLRNLPTLVLINGRRATDSGAGAVTGGKNFVDVNQIPVSAVARIEVLADGASAIYGSDAIGGVVNLILKRGFDGVTIGGRSGTADGGYYERSANVLAGRNLGGVDVTLMASTSHSSPLLQSNRSFTSPFFGVSSSLPGTAANGTRRLADGVVSPSQRNPVGTAATATTVAQLVTNGTYVATTPTELSAGFDASPYQSLLLAQDVNAIAGTFESDLIADDKLELFGDAELSLSRSDGLALPVSATGLTVPAGAPFNPLAASFTGVTFANLPTNHAYRNRTTAGRLMAGLRGRFAGDWRWETGLVYSLSKFKQEQTGLLFSPNVSKAIAGGFDAAGNPVAGGRFSKLFSNFSINDPLVLQPALDPFAVAAGVTSASLENLFGIERIDSRSRLASFDASSNGRLFSLPAGSVDVAIGVSARKETLESAPDPNSRVSDPVTHQPGVNSQNWLGGLFFDPFSAERKVYAAFAESRLPLTSGTWGVAGLRELDLVIAERFERYSDAGNSTAPKIGFRWQPFDRQITVRGSWAKSFAAPSLYFLFSPQRLGRTSTTLLATAFGSNYSGLPYNTAGGGNPDLKPTHSTSKYLGVTLQPAFIPRLSLNVDYLNVELRDFPGSLTQATVLNSVNDLGSASPYYQNVTADYPNGDPRALRPFAVPGSLLAFLTNKATGFGDPLQALRLYNADSTRNLGAVSSKSLTMSADYVVPTDKMGTFTLSSVAAVLLNYEFTAVPGSSPVQLEGHSTSSLQFAGTLPKTSVRSSIDWAMGQAQLTLGNTYMSATTDTGANGTVTPEIPVDRYTTWDARAAYTFMFNNEQKLKAAVGVNNISDKMPPNAARAFPQTRGDTSTFSPIGRQAYATVSVEF